MNIAQIVKQIAVDVDDRTVVVELICSDAYGALVLYDDITSRLKTDGVISFILKTRAQIEGEVSR